MEYLVVELRKCVKNLVVKINYIQNKKKLKILINKKQK